MFPKPSSGKVRSMGTATAHNATERNATPQVMGYRTNERLASLVGLRAGYVVPRGALILELTDADGTSGLWHRSRTCSGDKPSRSAVESTSAPLSQAEWAVARLVAEGLTNREIAERLFVSHRTVDTHVSHALSKLAMTSRVQLATFVLHQAR